MRTTLTTLALAALIAAAAADEKQPPLAKVRLAGEMSTIIDRSVNGKTNAQARFGTPGGLKVELTSAAPLASVHFASIKASMALITDGTDDLLQQLKDKKLDAKGFKKGMEQLRAESKTRGKAMTIVEGTLTLADKKLRLTGTARVIDTKKLDKDLPIGGAVVEGEAKAGKFKYDKDKEATLSIQNGALPILVVGKAVGDQERKGKLRVTGVLKQGAGGELVLEATKVEAVK